MIKLRSLLASRKFWAAVIGLAVSIGLIGPDDGAALGDAVVQIVSVFIGATALEDGLSRMKTNG